MVSGTNTTSPLTGSSTQTTQGLVRPTRTLNYQVRVGLAIGHGDPERSDHPPDLSTKDRGRCANHAMACPMPSGQALSGVPSKNDTLCRALPSGGSGRSSYRGQIRRFNRDPVPGQLGDHLGERDPPWRRNLVQHGGMEHHQRRVRRCLRDQLTRSSRDRHVRAMVGSAAAMAAAARSRGPAVIVLRPDERRVEPGDVRWIGRVERIEIPARPATHRAAKVGPPVLQESGGRALEHRSLEPTAWSPYR